MFNFILTFFQRIFYVLSASVFVSSGISSTQAYLRHPNYLKLSTTISISHQTITATVCLRSSRQIPSQFISLFYFHPQSCLFSVSVMLYLNITLFCTTSHVYAFFVLFCIIPCMKYHTFYKINNKLWYFCTSSLSKIF